MKRVKKRMFKKLSEMTECPKTKKPIDTEFCRAHCMSSATNSQLKRSYYVCLLSEYNIDLKQARREFRILVDRCGCSKAGISITPTEAGQMSERFETKIEPHIPDCTPTKCFPYLTKLLYPKGGCCLKSNMSKAKKKKYCQQAIEEREKK